MGLVKNKIILARTSRLDRSHLIHRLESGVIKSLASPGRTEDHALDTFVRRGEALNLEAGSRRVLGGEGGEAVDPAV